MLKEIVLGGTEGIQDLIPGADQDHEATDTEKGTILDTIAGTVALLQDTDHEAVHLEDHTTEGLTPEAVQEAEDAMDLEEPSIPRLTEAGEAVLDQDLAVELLCA